MKGSTYTHIHTNPILCVSYWCLGIFPVAKWYANNTRPSYYANVQTIFAHQCYFLIKSEKKNFNFFPSHRTQIPFEWTWLFFLSLILSLPHVNHITIPIISTAPITLVFGFFVIVGESKIIWKWTYTNNDRKKTRWSPLFGKE